MGMTRLKAGCSLCQYTCCYIRRFLVLHEDKVQAFVGFQECMGINVTSVDVAVCNCKRVLFVLLMLLSLAVSPFSSSHQQSGLRRMRMRPPNTRRTPDHLRKGRRKEEDAVATPTTNKAVDRMQRESFPLPSTSTLSIPQATTKNTKSTTYDLKEVILQPHNLNMLLPFSFGDPWCGVWTIMVQPGVNWVSDYIFKFLAYLFGNTMHYYWYALQEYSNTVIYPELRIFPVIPTIPTIRINLSYLKRDDRADQGSAHEETRDYLGEEYRD
ncbi:hypothetical protein EV426DRAFT_5111 [Tirmania nivea]|nr:hypothetical protein EV426DRAFT_5111 [Tirmania nivea]